MNLCYGTGSNLLSVQSLRQVKRFKGLKIRSENFPDILRLLENENEVQNAQTLSASQLLRSAKHADIR